MQTIKRILCPTDFSACAEKAAMYAKQLARETSAELFLFHAFDSPVRRTLPREKPQSCDASLPNEPVTASRDSASDSSHFRQTAGTLGEAICWRARDRQCDLIVMGTHGQTGMTHILYGGITEYVLRHATCPVLTIRDDDTTGPQPEESVVIPVMEPQVQVD